MFSIVMHGVNLCQKWYKCSGFWCFWFFYFQLNLQPFSASVKEEFVCIHVSCTATEFWKGFHPFLCTGKCAYPCAYKSSKLFNSVTGWNWKQKSKNWCMAGAPAPPLAQECTAPSLPSHLRLPQSLEVMETI